MYELETFLIFIAIVALLIYNDRKKIKIEGIVIIRRTEKGRSFIENITRKHERFWNIFMKTAVVVAIPVMVFAFFFFALNSAKIISGETKEGAMLLLPGPVSKAHTAPGVLIMPWYFWVIGIFVVLIAHEFSHGIASRLGKIKIKSLGWLLLLFLPGAFCEPDEKKLQKAKRSIRLKVYAAGSFANIVVALLALVVSIAFTSTFFQPAGLMYGVFYEGGPIDRYNVTGSIMEISGNSVTSVDELREVLGNISPNTTVQLKTSDGLYTIITDSRPDNLSGSYLGIGPMQGFDFGLGLRLGGEYETYYAPKSEFAYASSLLDFLRNLLGWIFILNVGIGIINLLPLKPFDGGLVLEALVEKFASKKNTVKIVTAVSLVSAVLLIFNIIGPYLF